MSEKQSTRQLLARALGNIEFHYESGRKSSAATRELIDAIRAHMDMNTYASEYEKEGKDETAVTF